VRRGRIKEKKGQKGKGQARRRSYLQKGSLINAGGGGINRPKVTTKGLWGTELAIGGESLKRGRGRGVGLGLEQAFESRAMGFSDEA